MIRPFNKPVIHYIPSSSNLFTLCGLYRGSNSGVFYVMGNLDQRLATCTVCSTGQLELFGGDL